MHTLDALIEADLIIDDIDTIVTTAELSDADKVARIDALIETHRNG